MANNAYKNEQDELISYARTSESESLISFAFKVDEFVSRDLVITEESKKLLERLSRTTKALEEYLFKLDNTK